LDGLPAYAYREDGESILCANVLLGDRAVERMLESA
jgi:hypothetical protein